MIYQFTPNDKRIVKCLYYCIAALGGQSDILGVIGSWGDSLPDEDVLLMLEDWLNEQLSQIKDVEVIEFCKKYYTSSYPPDYRTPSYN